MLQRESHTDEFAEVSNEFKTAFEILFVQLVKVDDGPEDDANLVMGFRINPLVLK